MILYNSLCICNPSYFAIQKDTILNAFILFVHTKVSLHNVTLFKIYYNNILDKNIKNTMENTPVTSIYLVIVTILGL